MTSKNVIATPSINRASTSSTSGSTCSTSSSKASWLIGTPSMLIRSVMSTRWGLA